MDERPNRFIMNNEEPLDDNGFSSSSNPNRIDNFDNSINNKLNNDQNDQLNLKNGRQFNAGRVGNLGVKPVQQLEQINELNDENNSKNNINTDKNKNNITQNPSYLKQNAMNKVANKLPPGYRQAAKLASFFVNRRNNKKKAEQEEQERLMQEQQEQEMQERINQELNGGEGLNQEELNNNGLQKNNGLFGGLKNRIKPSFRNKSEAEKDLKKSTNIVKRINKIWIRISSFLLSLPFVLPLVLIVVIVGILIGTVTQVVTTVANVVTDIGESFINFITFKGFHTNETLVKNFEEKIAKVSSIYPEMDTESLKAALYYGFYSFDEYLQEIENEESDDIEDYDVKHKFNFKKLKVYTFTVANQLIYSTVTFDNDLISTPNKEDVDDTFELEPNTLREQQTLPKDVDKTKKSKDGKTSYQIKCSETSNGYLCGNYKCKKENCEASTKEKITYSYSCPAGSIKVNLDGTSGFCNNNVGTVKIKDSSGREYNTASADYCTNLVSQSNIDAFKKVDPDFDDKQKCVTFTFETSTERSIEKYNNFLKYVMIPENYYDQSLSSSYSYSWSEFVSKFSEDADGIFSFINDKATYNIPAHAIGEGKIDLYSKLSDDEKLKTDRIISSLLSIVSAAKGKDYLNERYHIPGDISLPLDFSIKSTPEETIKSRITSGYGPRTAKVAGESTYHYAIDFSGKTGTPIYSILDGVVVETKSGDSCGISTRIGHDINGDGSYDYYTKYCHMSSRFVHVGDIVYNGQKIGLIGSTGVATGPHLHFEIRNEKNERINPLPYLLDIATGSSQLSSVINEITPAKKQELESSFASLIYGKTKREAVAITAKFLVDNLSGLPNFCDGYSSSLIDDGWYKEKPVYGCGQNGNNAKYGLSNVGFINWAFTQNGLTTTKLYKFNELINLGARSKISDSSVQVGDIAYNGDDIGIIIELSEERAVVVFVSDKGLTVESINRKLAASPFKYAVSLTNFYGG